MVSANSFFSFSVFRMVVLINVLNFFDLFTTWLVGMSHETNGVVIFIVGVFGWYVFAFVKLFGIFVLGLVVVKFYFETLNSGHLFMALVYRVFLSFVILVYLAVVVGNVVVCLRVLG